METIPNTPVPLFAAAKMLPEDVQYGYHTLRHFVLTGVLRQSVAKMKPRGKKNFLFFARPAALIEELRAFCPANASRKGGAA